MFKPNNDLEALLQAAAKEPRQIPAFYKKLLESEIYILTPETSLQPRQRRSLKYKEKINVATVEFPGPGMAACVHLEEPDFRLSQGTGGLPGGRRQGRVSSCCLTRISG